MRFRAELTDNGWTVRDQYSGRTLAEDDLGIDQAHRVAENLSYLSRTDEWLRARGFATA